MVVRVPRLRPDFDATADLSIDYSGAALTVHAPRPVPGSTPRATGAARRPRTGATGDAL